MPLILITNDDGVDALGIRVLADALRGSGDVLVVAPDRPRSAAGMSLTFHKPLRIGVKGDRDGVRYAVSGNPADCVFIAVQKLLGGGLPSVVVSGINYGENVAAQTVYASGTVAAAIQGAIMGIPSIALSLTIPDRTPPPESKLASNFKVSAEHSRKIVEWVLRRGLPESVDYLNVNFPYKVSRNTQAEITKLGLRKYENEVLRRTDPKGRPYYWLFGRVNPSGDFEEGSDVRTVLLENKISITPMKLDASASKSEGAFHSLLDHFK